MAGFFGGGGGNVTALVENGGLWQTIINSCSYVTKGLYITSSNATPLPLSFL